MNKITINTWPKWLSLDLAGTYMSCSRKTIERLIASGDLKFSRIRGRRFVSTDAIDSMMKKHEQQFRGDLNG